MNRNARLVVLLLLSAIAVACCLACGGDSDDGGVILGTATAAPSASATTTATAAATRTATTAAANPAERCARSGDASLLVLVDKVRALPATSEPSDLVALPDRLDVPGFPGQRMRKDAADALVKLLDGADREGIELRARSTYRSYAEQQTTFQYWVDQLGLAQAERESARPGHSEHQLGTVADVVSQSINWELITPFGDTTEGKWLVAHAKDYGFAISYPADGEAVTGYIYEPWHIRYIGTDCAQGWAQSGLVLVRFLEAVAQVRR